MINPRLRCVLLCLVLCAGNARAYDSRWDAGHATFQAFLDFFGLDPGSSNCNASGSPFEVATGNLRLAWVDFRIPTVGPELAVVRTYNSIDRRNGLFGAGWSFTYDVRLIATTDGAQEFGICRQADGKRLRFVRNADGTYTPPPDTASTLTRQQDGTLAMREPNGAQIQFNRDGHLVSVRDRNGNTVTITRDAVGFPTQVTSGSRSLRFTRGANGKIESVTDPLNRSFRYRYDINGNLTQVIDPKGNTTQFAYDQNRRITKITDARGNSPYSVEYDPVGRVKSYKENGGLWEVQYEKGATIETDPRGNSWRFVYNENGSITKITDPLGGSEGYAYDGKSNLISYTDKNGNSTTYRYTPEGRLVSDLDALGASNRYESDSSGRVTAAFDARGGRLGFNYDPRGNLIGLQDALNRQAGFEFDARGLLATATDPNGQKTQFRYSQDGDLTEVIDPLNGSTRYAYDAAGQVVSRSDAAGRTTRFEYDANGQITRVNNALAGDTLFTYDAAGNLTSVRDQLSNRTTLEYDGDNRVAKVKDPAGAEKGFEYDDIGRLARVVDANGQTTHFRYDELGRLVEKINLDTISNFRYDAADNLIEATDSFSSLTFSYDKRNRLVATRTGRTNAQAATEIRYAYDETDNLVSLTLPDGSNVRYGYDAVGHTTTVTGFSGDVTRLTFDPASRLTNTALPNGVSIDNTFDALDRLTQQTVRGPTTSSKSFSFDPVGNRVTESGTGGMRTFSYDPLDRLTSATGGGLPAESYTYTGRDLRSRSHLSSSYLYNAQAWLTKDEKFTYSYDRNGNLTGKTNKSSRAETRFDYNTDDQLIRVTLPDGRMVGFAYDVLGRRIEKNINGAISRYIYSGDAIVAEQNSAGQTTARWVHGPGIDNPIAIERNGQRYYYVRDSTGSTVALMDSSGATLRSYQYDSFGRILSQTGSVANPFTFTGREFDSETGLYYYRARYYDPEIGRFLQRDPISLTASYAYVHNNPLAYVDPSGNVPWLIAACGGGALFDSGIAVGSNLWNGRSWYCGVGGAAIQGCAFGAASAIGGRAAGALWSSLREVRIGEAIIARTGGARTGVARTGIVAQRGGLNLHKWNHPTSTTSAGWREGDYFLNLPNQGSARANWIQNSSKLRAEMAKGNPIFDSFRDPLTGHQIPTRGFLNAERNLLGNHGWKYNPQTGAYHPPGGN